MHAAARPKSETLLVTLLCLLTAMDALSIDVFLPALPRIANDLGIPDHSAQATLAVFLLTLAATQSLIGPLCDRIGSRVVLLGCLAAFAAGGLLSGAAASPESFMLGRILQALGAAAGMVIPRAVVAKSYDARKSARLMSLMMITLGVVPIIGPPVGGLILKFWSWQSIFFGLYAVGAGLFLYSSIVFPSSASEGRIGNANVLQALARISANRRFILMALSSAASFGGMFSFIGAMPYIFSGSGSWGEQNFPWIAGVISSGFIVGGTINFRLLKYVSESRLTSMALIAQVACGFVFLMNAHGSIAFGLVSMLAGFAYMVSLGFILANSMSLALTAVGENYGFASSALGFLQFLFASAGTMLGGIELVARHSVGVVVLCCAAIALAAFCAVQIARTAQVQVQ